MLIENVAGVRSGNEKNPSWFVTVVLTNPLSVAVTATFAPGTTAPDPSATVPDNELEMFWANANPTAINNRVSERHIQIETSQRL